MPRLMRRLARAVARPAGIAAGRPAFRTRSLRWLGPTAVVIGVIAAAVVFATGHLRALHGGIPNRDDRHRAIFIAGLCSSAPVGTAATPGPFREIYEFLSDELGYQTFSEKRGPAELFGFSYATSNTVAEDPELIV